MKYIWIRIMCHICLILMIAFLFVVNSLDDFVAVIQIHMEGYLYITHLALITPQGVRHG